MRGVAEAGKEWRKKDGEEHEAELEEEAKGEQWATGRREHHISVEFRLRSTRSGFTLAVDGTHATIYLGIEGWRVDRLWFVQRDGKLHRQNFLEDGVSSKRFCW